MGVRDLRNHKEVEEALCAFFGQSSMEDVAAMPHSAERSHISSSATPGPNSMATSGSADRTRHGCDALLRIVPTNSRR